MRVQKRVNIGRYNRTYKKKTIRRPYTLFYVTATIIPIFFFDFTITTFPSTIFRVFPNKNLRLEIHSLRVQVELVNSSAINKRICNVIHDAR